ncbi:Helix-turn-helix type 11 domain-containing protein, partial [Dysosmobacter welbionis]
GSCGAGGTCRSGRACRSNRPSWSGFSNGTCRPLCSCGSGGTRLPGLSLQGCQVFLLRSLEAVLHRKAVGRKIVGRVVVRRSAALTPPHAVSPPRRNIPPQDRIAGRTS